MNELKKKVKSWLESQGYPLEMYVAKKFAEFGFDIGQSVYYKDIETGKSREIDVIAFKYFNSYGVWFNLAFVIECKLSRDKPWIVFKNKDLLNDSEYIKERFATKNTKLLIDLILENHGIENCILIGKKSRLTGYSVTQAFTQGQDITFAALNGVTKSIQYFVSETNKSDRRIATIYFPIIVVDGKLFESELNSSGELSIEEVRKCEFTWMRSFDAHRLISLSILTKEGLEDFIQDLRNQCDLFLKEYESEINEICKKYPVNSRI